MMQASDKFGLENVYYRYKGDAEPQIQILSDLKTSLQDHGFGDFSPDGISSYFTFRYPILENTMFEGIRRLDVGCSLINDRTYPYWRPSFSTLDIPEAVAIDEVEQLLRRAIAKIVGRSQTIGIALSGGLDSSLIAAMCRQLYPDRKIRTYSCGFHGHDEFFYSRQVADLVSDAHSELVLGKDDFIGPDSIVPSLIKHKCAPLHPNETALAYAERKARLDLCDAFLCGEGADDLFGGYGHNSRMYLTYAGELDGFHDYVIGNYRYFTREERLNLLNIQYVADIESKANVFNEPTAPKKPEDKMLYFIQRLHTRGLIERGHNALSYNQFGNGFPFIDDALVEFANSLPFDMKVRWTGSGMPDIPEGLSYAEISDRFDTTKYILKKVAERYLPERIVYRTKVGFPVPFERWFEQDMTWDLDETVFRTRDISGLSGWKKFMVINLDLFVKIFNTYRTR